MTRSECQNDLILPPEIRVLLAVPPPDITQCILTCQLGEIKFGREGDRAHLLVGIHPALNLSTVSNNLKSSNSYRMAQLTREKVNRVHALRWE